ncbi:MAG: hypothetical protein ABEI74_04640 [Candidatus Pacearchaeota archaeon]
MTEEEKEENVQEKEDQKSSEGTESQKNDQGESSENSNKEKSESEKEQEKRQNRQLRNFLIVLGLVLVFTLAVFYVASQPEKVQYKNLEFKSYTDSGGITFYREGVPQFGPRGKVVREELFSLRTHPEKLKNISFNGSIEFRKNLTISTNGERLACDYGAISTGNIAYLYNFLKIKTKTIQNKTLCQENDNTMNLRLVRGNKTSLSQTGPSCYKATIRDCKILPPSEKFMAETLVEVHQNINAKLNRSS